VNTEEGLLDMLRDLIDLYPLAELTVIRLVHGGQLWVDDGREYVATYDLLKEA
jgi:hypothetical protein